MTELTHPQERERQLQILAVSKWMQDTVRARVKPAEDAAKAWLAHNDMTPGSKQAAIVNDVEVATVSRSKVTQKLAITDETGYAIWLEENGWNPQYTLTLTVTDTALYDRFVAFAAEYDNKQVDVSFKLKPQHTSQTQLDALLATLKDGGELPDGLDFKETGGSISVRMTPAQKEALYSQISAVHAVDEVITGLGIEA